MAVRLEDLFDAVDRDAEHPAPREFSSMFGLQPPEWESQEDADAFAAWIASYRWRPWDWVLVCYPWGEEGTDLEGRMPEPWQREYFMELQRRLQEIIARHPDKKDAELELREVIRTSVASGHGVGKTATVAMLIHWFVSTMPDCEVVVTASTQTQLSTKTWRELAVWQQRAINGWAFEWTATAYKCRDAAKTWFAAAVPWSDANPQAFAGTHARYVLVLFDEASGISPKIWEVIEGAFTTGLCIFAAFGNPSEAEGGFFDTQHRFRHRWFTMCVDAREVTFANQQQIAEWIEDHGEDSDFVRVRVRGVFPKQSQLSYISAELVFQAQKRNIEWKFIPITMPLLMGVDVARGGQDSNVILLRRGRKVHKKISSFQARDILQIAAWISREIREQNPSHVFVDETGVGAGVVDQLIHLGHRNIIGVMTGGTRTMTEREKLVHANLRSLIWERTRSWLETGDIPEDCKQLASDLSTPGFTFHKRTQRQVIESKEDIKARGFPSPDFADALTLTFAEIIANNPGGGGGSYEPEVV